MKRQRGVSTVLNVVGSVVVVIASIVVLVGVWHWVGGESSRLVPSSPPVTSLAPTPPSEGTRYTLVERVIDGDTFVVQGGERVRIIGVNTPETGECWHDEATYTLQAILLPGAGVTLRPDSAQPTTDRYGRTLALVTAEDGADVGTHLLSAGAAEHWDYPGEPEYQAQLYAELEEQARALGQGRWGHCPAS